MSKSRDEVWAEWREAVNMAPQEVQDWLETDESKSVGAKEGDGSQIGSADRGDQADEQGRADR